MNDDTSALGTNEPTFYYPAIPNEVAANHAEVIVAYRRALGRERMYQVGGVVWAALALWFYVRGSKTPTTRRSSRSR